MKRKEIMEQKRIIKLEDFFNFDSKEPINRLAYTEDDMKYKLKIIEKMKALGMADDVIKKVTGLLPDDCQ